MSERSESIKGMNSVHTEAMDQNCNKSSLAKTKRKNQIKSQKLLKCEDLLKELQDYKERDVRNSQTIEGHLKTIEVLNRKVEDLEAEGNDLEQEKSWTSEALEESRSRLDEWERLMEMQRTERDAAYGELLEVRSQQRGTLSELEDLCRSLQQVLQESDGSPVCSSPEPDDLCGKNTIHQLKSMMDLLTFERDEALVTKNCLQEQVATLEPLQDQVQSLQAKVQQLQEEHDQLKRETELLSCENEQQWQSINKHKRTEADLNKQVLICSAF